MPARPVKFTRYCLTQWISKLPGSFEIHWVRQNLISMVLFGIKDLWTSAMTVQLKSNLFIGPVNIFLNFWHCYKSDWLVQDSVDSSASAMELPQSCAKPSIGEINPEQDGWPFPRDILECISWTKITVLCLKLMKKIFLCSFKFSTQRVNTCIPNTHLSIERVRGRHLWPPGYWDGSHTPPQDTLGQCCPVCHGHWGCKYDSVQY